MYVRRAVGASQQRIAIVFFRLNSFKYYNMDVASKSLISYWMSSASGESKTGFDFYIDTITILTTHHDSIFA